MIGLALCSPVGMVTAQVVGVAGIALRVHRRQNFRRIAFNMAQRAFTALVAVFVFQSMTRALGSEWPAILGGSICPTLTADVMSGLLSMWRSPSLKTSPSRSTRSSVPGVA